MWYALDQMRLALGSEDFDLYIQQVRAALQASRDMHEGMLVVMWLPDNECNLTERTTFGGHQQWGWHVDAKASVAAVQHHGLSAATVKYSRLEGFPAGFDIAVTERMQPALDKHGVRAFVAVGPKRTRIIFEFQ